MSATTRPPLTVFLSYAEKDKSFKQELENHLVALQQNNQIFFSGEHEIQSGTNWRDVINPRLLTADMVLLLLSSNLLGSGYCTGAEVLQATERHKDGKALLIPIVLQRVDLSGLPISLLQTLPGNEKGIWTPITAWENRDEAWWKVAQGIRHATEVLHYRRGTEKGSS